MRNDGPSCTRQRCRNRWLFGDDGLADRNGEIELILRKQVFGNRGQYGTGFRVLRIRIGKLEATVEVAAMPGRPVAAIVLPCSVASCSR